MHLLFQLRHRSGSVPGTRVADKLNFIRPHTPYSPCQLTQQRSEFDDGGETGWETEEEPDQYAIAVCHLDEEKDSNMTTVIAITQLLVFQYHRFQDSNSFTTAQTLCPVTAPVPTWPVPQTPLASRKPDPWIDLQTDCIDNA